MPVKLDTISSITSMRDLMFSLLPPAGTHLLTGEEVGIKLVRRKVFAWRSCFRCLERECLVGESVLFVT